MNALPPDGAATVINTDLQREAINLAGMRFDPRLLIADARGVFHNELPAIGLLLDGTSFLNRFDKRLGRAVKPWHFSAVDPDFAVVDAQPGERGQDVFHHFDVAAAVGKNGSPRHFHAVGDVGRNANFRRKISADKDDAGIRRGRTKFNLDVLA